MKKHASCYQPLPGYNFLCSTLCVIRYSGNHLSETRKKEPVSKQPTAWANDLKNRCPTEQDVVEWPKRNRNSDLPFSTGCKNFLQKIIVTEAQNPITAYKLSTYVSHKVLGLPWDTWDTVDAGTLRTLGTVGHLVRVTPSGVEPDHEREALIISAKTPAAVTSAPAPAPFMTSGCSAYRFV